jgi:putative phage-type endonuclease
MRGGGMRREFSEKDDWLAWRREGLGASDIAVLFGKDPFRTKRQLWDSIVHGTTQFQTNAMARGKKVEETILPEVERRLGLVLEEQVCLEYEKWPVLRCTLDGWDSVGRMVVEMKYYASLERHEAQMDVPEHHMLQVQMQMLIAEARMGFYVHSHNGYDVKIHYITPDKAMQRQIVMKAKDFWDEFVLTKKEPPREDRDIENREDEECVRRCIRLKQLEPLALEFEALKDELRGLSEGRSFRCEGVCVAVQQRPGLPKYKEIAELDWVQAGLKARGIGVKDFKGEPIRACTFYVSRK